MLENGGVLYWGTIALTLACGGRGRPVYLAPTSLNAPRDSAAALLAEQLRSWGFRAMQQDSGGASIVTASLRLRHGRKLAGQSFGYWADCGKELGLSRAATADELRVEVFAAVHPYEVASQSYATPEASFAVYERKALGLPIVDCSSRGRLEQALIEAVQVGLKRAPPTPRIRQQQFYALSPRPGDSLSLPLADDPRLANPPSLDACAWDSLDLPYLDAKGEVTYAVSAEGIPDTATLTVQRLYGVDTRTFQVAARRLVASCRFHGRAISGGDSPDLVRQWLFFGAALALDYGSQHGIAISHNLPSDSLLARDLKDATMVSCPQPEPGLPPGRVEVQFVVGLDGKPELSTVRAVNATTPELAMAAPTLVKDCRFTPASLKGRRVRSLIRLPVIIRLR